MPKLKNLDEIADTLLVVGGLNLGLTLFNLNVVELVLGAIPFAVEVVYGAVGLSAVRKVWEMFN